MPAGSPRCSKPFACCFVCNPRGLERWPRRCGAGLPAFRCWGAAATVIWPAIIPRPKDASSNSTMCRKGSPMLTSGWGSLPFFATRTSSWFAARRPNAGASSISSGASVIRVIRKICGLTSVLCVRGISCSRKVRIAGGSWRLTTVRFFPPANTSGRRGPSFARSYGRFSRGMLRRSAPKTRPCRCATSVRADMISPRP